MMMNNDFRCLFLSFAVPLESQIKDQLRPFKQKIEKKSKEKGNLREQTTAEDTRKSEVLSDFNSQVRELRDISEKIDKYEKSDKPDALERLNEKTAALKSRLQEKNAELAKLKPELDKVTRIIEDQERQKKIILSNIDLISAGTRVQEIKKQIEALKGELSQIAGQETCNEEYAKAHRKKSELEANKQRHHGRRTGFVETIRGLKVSLKSRFS
jgi:chromosome segregation ATPase